MDRQGWDERYGARPQTFTAEPNKQVAEEIDGLPPGRALDLATGEGRHAVWLAGKDWQVAAVDFSGVGLRKGQARARDEGLSVAWAQADVHTLRFPPGAFDLILASFFHARPPDRAGFYERVAHALTPGGAFVLVGYDRAHATEGEGGPRDAELLIDTEIVAGELTSAGLRVERADTVRQRVPLPEGGETNVVNAILRAVRP